MSAATRQNVISEQFFTRAHDLARKASDELYQETMRRFELFADNVVHAESEWRKASKAFMAASADPEVADSPEIAAALYALKYWDMQYTLAKQTFGQFMRLTPDERKCELGI